MKKAEFRIIAILFTFFFAGCSNGNVSLTSSNISSESSKNLELKETTLSERLNNGDRQIWYKVDEKDGVPGKETHPSGVYVFEKGKVKYYDQINLTMSELSKMKDEEIILAAKKVEEDELEERINYSISDHEGLLRVSNESDILKINEVITGLKEIRPSELNLESVKYNIDLGTDSTGNRTERESLSFTSKAVLLPVFGNSVERGDIFQKEAQIGLNRMGERSLVFVTGYAKFQVYNEWFTGLIDEDDYYFVMQDSDGNGELSFVLDQPGAEDVTVDEQ